MPRRSRRVTPDQQLVGFAALALAGLALTTLACCGDDLPAGLSLAAPESPGKRDPIDHRGPPEHADPTTRAWPAPERWDERDTPSARRAGLAWPADSGLTWDEKYAAWIASLPPIAGPGGIDSFAITTPWGKRMPAPQLDGARLALFLHITFAAWHRLPLVLAARDVDGAPVYLGHIGVRRGASPYPGAPAFGRDFLDPVPFDAAAAWPRDGALRREAVGEDDVQPAVGGASFGAYLDEIHLDKRAAHLTLLALRSLDADAVVAPANAFAVVADAVRPGDLAIGADGVIHLVAAAAAGDDGIELALVSASPDRAPRWLRGAAAKAVLVGHRRGAVVVRPRTARTIEGAWWNVVPPQDRAIAIDPRDVSRAVGQALTLERLVAPTSSGAQADGLVAVIADARQALRSDPASCGARERREDAFARLYRLMAVAFHLPPGAVDGRFRASEDAVFPALDRGRARLCCRAAGSPEMAAVVLDLAAAEAAAAPCAAPTPFRDEGDDLGRWRRFAAASGRSWPAWRDDGACRAEGEVDRVRPGAWTPPCGWSIERATCDDGYEPDDRPGQARAIAIGDVRDLAVCGGQGDWLRLPGGGRVAVGFAHAEGDLDVQSFDAGGREVALSDGTGDGEAVEVPPGGSAVIYGYLGAANRYRVSVTPPGSPGSPATPRDRGALARPAAPAAPPSSPARRSAAAGRN